MNDSNNKLGRVPILLGLVIAGLSALTAAGPVAVGDWTTKTPALYAGLTRGTTGAEAAEEDAFLAAATIPAPTAAATPGSAGAATEQQPAAADGFTPIEDFSGTGTALWHFFDALGRRAELGRPVRVAFLGDSFVEGDILTSDLRESLQARYGGRGVGFVPLAAIDIWRNTVYLKHSGWTVRSSLYGSQSARYLLAGQTFVPSADSAATFGFQATGEYEHAKSFDTAALLYASDTPAVLTCKLGGGEPQRLDLVADGRLRLLPLRRGGMRSGELAVAADGGFTGYGVFLNDAAGVCVDNYSLRSSSGLQLLRADAGRLAELNALVPYDLVVLQYGMNVMQPEQADYASYTASMVRVVERLRAAMPGVSILVLGVGDRNFRLDDGSMGTRVGVVNLVEAQRQIARQTQTAFWNTYMAMGGRNSMSAFVAHDPPLANKDYSHINYAGGRRIGLSLAEALVEAAVAYE